MNKHKGEKSDLQQPFFSSIFSFCCRKVQQHYMFLIPDMPVLNKHLDYSLEKEEEKGITLCLIYTLADWLYLPQACSGNFD
jgi:hypothetical protein